MFIQLAYVRDFYSSSIRFFKGQNEGLGRIDWILVRGPVEVLAVETVLHAVGGRYPSDHYPVVATLRVLPH